MVNKIKKLGINLFEEELMNLQKEANKREMKNQEKRANNRCRNCEHCLFEKIIEEAKYDITLFDIIPQQGDIWDKEYQCKEILRILEEEDV